MNDSKSFFDGPFGKYFLPGIILQSVLIGGGFATGREIVEYGAKFGSLGWIAGIVIFLGFTLMAFLTFELARQFKAYDYRNLLIPLIGKAWILFDILYIVMVLLVIAVMSSATGEILKSTVGLNYWVGVLLCAVLVGLLNFYGKRLIERLKTFGTIALYTAYIIFGALVISSTWGEAKNVLSLGDTSFIPGEVSVWAVIGSGILYVGYCLTVYPAALFTVRRQTSRKETMWAGIISGFLMCIPWFITYFCILGFYPSQKVLSASVPWLVMLENLGPGVMIMFGVVVGWTLVETATGMIHGLLDRIDAHMHENFEKHLSQTQSGLIALSALGFAVLLAQVGIIDLISMGYRSIAYGVIVVYALPILTIGSYKILKKRQY